MEANCTEFGRQAADSPFRLVFMGRLVGWKAVDITLDALACARSPGIAAELDIFGDGPERVLLEDTRQRRAFLARCTFTVFFHKRSASIDLPRRTPLF